MFSSTVVALFASAILVAGHGTPDAVVMDGVSYPGTANWDSPDNDKSPVRGIPLNTGFVRYDKVNTADIACSSSGYKGRPLTPPVKAGGVVSVRWGGDGGQNGKQWPHPEGPIIAYLASCEGSCSTFDPSNAKFFKIYEEGLDPSKSPNQAGNDHLPWGQGLWAQNRIQYEDSWSHITIPADIAPGEYLLRHELISLHGAHTTAEGAQYYPACVQVKVTGSGTAKPAGTLATQLYTTADGIVNIYIPSDKHGISASTYKIPGPALYVPGKTNTTPASSSSSSSSKGAHTAGKCRAKRSLRLRDETRQVYDRALARAQARRAHSHKRTSH